MTMVSLAQYLANPCRASSIPYWKAKNISLPANMVLLHHDDFDQALLGQFCDEPYFRLIHDLKHVDALTLSTGFSFSVASLSEFVDHINVCYPGAKMTAAILDGYRSHEVFCPELWVVIRDERTGQIIASGIGELDLEIGEGVLEWIQVSPEYRGSGFGQCIVTELLRRLKDRASFATVSGQCNNASNPEALYRKCGFTGNDVWHIMRKR